MAWKVKRSPLLPTEPVFQHPERCANCGHLNEPDTALGINESHADDVGCLVEGGTKYLEDEIGNGIHACSCLAFVPVKKEENL